MIQNSEAFMNEDLKYTFSNINEWLKFGETKNAGLLAFNAVTIFGVLQADKMFPEEIKFFEWILVAFFCLSICISFYTILPISNNWFRFYKKLGPEDFNKAKGSSNILFFGDVAQLSSDQFIEIFEDKHQVTLSRAERDFGNQITNNAEICQQKYALFNIAGLISFAAVVMAVFLVIYAAISQ